MKTIASLEGSISTAIGDDRLSFTERTAVRKELAELAAKAEMFDEMLLAIEDAGLGAALDAKHVADKVKRGIKSNERYIDIIIDINTERYAEMQAIVDKANKIVEAK